MASVRALTDSAVLPLVSVSFACLTRAFELLLSRILDRGHRGLLERAAGALERPERLVDLALRGVLVAQMARALARAFSSAVQEASV